ncbi:MAG: ADOP family duplicated permease [Acidobacteriota bacterium]
MPTLLRQALRRQGWLAMLTLAVGLGAAAVGFAVLDAVLLRPLPFPDAGDLYSLHHTAPGLKIPRLEQSDGTYLLYRDSPALDSLGVYRVDELDVVAGGGAERLVGIRVSTELLPLLGVRPRLGRGFTAEEEAPGGGDAVLLGDGYWSRRFGGDPDVVGRSLTVDGRPRTVVGVLPPSFRFPSPEVDLVLPLALDPLATQAALFRFSAIARLPAGGEAGSVLGDLRGRLQRLPVDYPESRWTEEMLGSSRLAPVLTPLRTEIVGEIQGLLWGLGGALGMLLLVACSNVATLLLVRAEDRRPELAVRAALGADGGRLRRAHLAPALVIGGLAGGLALLLADGALRWLVRQGPESLPSIRAIGVDLRTVAFTLGLGIALAGLVGVLAGRGGADSPARWLRAGKALPRQRWRQLLVVFQIAVAALLWVASGAVATGWQGLRTINPGFDPQSVETFGLRLPASRYPDGEARSAFYGRLLDRLRALPEVQTVGGVHRLPLTGGGSNNGWSAEDVPRPPDEVPPVFPTRWASEGYFEALGIPLREGRLLEPADRELGRSVAVVGESFARHFWGDGGALGRRIALGTGGDDARWLTVVGVVGDVRDRGLAHGPDGIVYLPLVTQLPGRSAAYAPPRLSLVMRVRSPESAAQGGLLSSTRRIVAELDPELPLGDPRSLDRWVADDLAESRFALGTLLAAAGVTGLLGLVGLYGLMAYWAQRRRRDFGVRLALGARPGRLRRWVVFRAMVLTALGLALGLPAATVVVDRLGPWLLGLPLSAPWAFPAVTFLFLAVAAVAADGPARRAAAVDPQAALRTD